jgi:hypothetical protein
MRHVPRKETKFCRLNCSNPWRQFADIPPASVEKKERGEAPLSSVVLPLILQPRVLSQYLDGLPQFIPTIPATLKMPNRYFGSSMQ